MVAMKNEKLEKSKKKILLHRQPR